MSEDDEALLAKGNLTDPAKLVALNLERAIEAMTMVADVHLPNLLELRPPDLTAVDEQLDRIVDLEIRLTVLLARVTW